MKKVFKNQSTLKLLGALGKEKTLSKNDFVNCQRFIQTVVYNWKENESYVQTRIKMYKEQVTKTSLALPPDQDSCYQAIKRAQYQTYLGKMSPNKH